MLVLSRKEDQQIIIGDKLATVTVVELRGDSVRLGVEADNDVPVHRREVWVLIQRQRREAAERLAARLNSGNAFERHDWTADELLSTRDPMLRAALNAEVRAGQKAGAA